MNKRGFEDSGDGETAGERLFIRNFSITVGLRRRPHDVMMCEKEEEEEEVMVVVAAVTRNGNRGGDRYVCM
jgi:hypothetical protein